MRIMSNQELAATSPLSSAAWMELSRPRPPTRMMGALRCFASTFHGAWRFHSTSFIQHIWLGVENFENKSDEKSVILKSKALLAPEPFWLSRSDRTNSRELQWHPKVRWGLRYSMACSKSWTSPGPSAIQSYWALDFDMDLHLNIEAKLKSFWIFDFSK